MPQPPWLNFPVDHKQYALPDQLASGLIKIRYQFLGKFLYLGEPGTVTAGPAHLEAEVGIKTTNALITGLLFGLPDQVVSVFFRM